MLLIDLKGNFQGNMILMPKQNITECFILSLFPLLFRLLNLPPPSIINFSVLDEAAENVVEGRITQQHSSYHGI